MARKQYIISLSDDEAALIKEMAWKNRKTFTAFVRDATLKECDSVENG